MIESLLQGPTQGENMMKKQKIIRAIPRQCNTGDTVSNTCGSAEVNAQWSKINVDDNRMLPKTRGFYNVDPSEGEGWWW